MLRKHQALSRSGVLCALLLICISSSGVAQDRWLAALGFGGLTKSSEGNALVSGLGAEIGVAGRYRAVARYLDRSRKLCEEDGACEAEARGFEAGVGARLGGAERILPFVQFLMGYSLENDYYGGGADPFFSASVVLGADLMVAPPVTLRVSAHHRRIPSAGYRPGREATNTGIFVGVGLSTG